MAAPEVVFGDLSLNGVNFRVDIGSYRVKDITDFSPRASVGGQSVVHSELGLVQPYTKASWVHGMGFHWETDVMGYLRTDGSVDTRHSGLAMLMTRSTSSETNNNQKDGFTIAPTINAIEYVLTWGAAGVRKLTGVTWSDEGAYGAVNFVLNTQNYTFICPDGARIRKITNSTGVHTDAGVNAGSTDYKWLIIHNGFIYAGKDGNSLVFRDDAVDLAGLAGAVADDPDVIVVGGGEMPTLGAVSLYGKLFVSRKDGLWQIGDDLIARRMLDYSSEVSVNNFRSMAVINNRLIYSVRDKVFMWNGTTVNDVTPNRITDTFPYTTYGTFDNFVSMGRFVYCSARTNESTYEEHILCFDGTFWHKIEDNVVTNGSNSISALGIDTLNNRLWYHIVAAADDTRYIPIQSNSEFPFADFPITGTHSLITSRLDLGFRRVTKSTPSLLVEGSNLTSTRYLTVYYSIDGAAFTEWGGTDGGDVNLTGVTEKVDPLGSVGSSLEYKYLQLRVDFTAATTGSTPILEGLTLRFMMRPKVLYGHSFAIVASQYARVGASRRSLSTAYEIIRAVQEARASEKPIILIDPFGLEHTGYISSVERRAIERHGRDERMGNPNIESTIFCNFVEIV